VFKNQRARSLRRRAETLKLRDCFCFGGASVLTLAPQTRPGHGPSRDDRMVLGSPTPNFRAWPTTGRGKERNAQAGAEKLAIIATEAIECQGKPRPV